MRSALWAKLKSAGPPVDAREEIARFTLWLPYQMHPFLAVAQQWIHRFEQEGSVPDRMQIERQAIKALRPYLKYMDQAPERSLLRAFLHRVENAMQRSLAAREAALQGERIDEHLDERLLSALNTWLAQRRSAQERELAAWLRRVLQAWRTQFLR